LENGSGQAGVRLVALAATDTAVVDRVAHSAASGSAASLDVLLQIIATQCLAAPAIARLTSDPSLREDIEQDVLMAVSRSIGRFRGEAKFTTWLYAVARHTGIAHLRRVRPATELDAEVHSSADLRYQRSVRPRLSSQVTQRRIVRDAIGSLPPAYRQAVFHRDIEGLSYQEIAERTGLEVNTVRSRIARGRALLAVRLS
jgi:RNA polymerase sigma-70 factor (ECF subfamily)